MTFINPTYLWALLGLAVPLAIHLWSNREGRTIRMGSISLLSESEPKQSSNVNLNEIWLLLLRMLAITILVFILAEPYLKDQTANTPVTYLIEPSLLEFDKVNTLLETLDPQYELRLLAEGFPVYSKDESIQTETSPPNYWQLATEMEQLATDSIVVFTNAFRAGFKGKRPQLNKNINWVILDPGETSRELLAVANTEGNARLLYASVENNNLKFEKETVSLNDENVRLNEQGDSIQVAGGTRQWFPLQTKDSLSVLIIHDENFRDEARYIRSSFNAIATYIDRHISIQTGGELAALNAENFAAVVWLREEPAEAINSPLLVFKQDSLASSLITRGEGRNVFHLNSRLNTENIVEEHLPEQLLALLDLNREIEEKIEKSDRRVMNPELIQTGFTGGNAGKSSIENTPLSKYLWMLLLGVLLAERGLARYKRQ